MKITLPMPPKALSPNARVHWRTKAKATKAYRNAAKWTASEDRPAKPWLQASAQATFYCKINRRRDGDNYLASLKSAFDGLRDAGVILDDSGITHLPVRFEVDKANPRVEIQIEEVTGTP